MGDAVTDFVSYAGVTDVNFYVPNAVADLWGGHAEDVADALRRSARRMNEQFAGMDKFDVLPFEEEDDGEYAEILVELNVLDAVLTHIMGINAGMQTEEDWRSYLVRRDSIWAGIIDGLYSFGSEPLDTTSGATEVFLSRASV